MKIIIRSNDDLEGYDLIDTDSRQAHDGDDAGEWVATVYDRLNAENIAAMLNAQNNQPEIP